MSLRSHRHHQPVDPATAKKMNVGGIQLRITFRIGEEDRMSILAETIFRTCDDGCEEGACYVPNYASHQLGAPAPKALSQEVRLVAEHVGGGHHLPAHVGTHIRVLVQHA